MSVSYEIEAASRIAEIRDQQIVALVLARKHDSEQASWNQRIKLPDYYNMYRGVRTAKWHPFKNDINLPYIFAMIETFSARTGRALFSGGPVVYEGDESPGGGIAGRYQQALYNQQMANDHMFVKGYQFVKSAAMYGVGLGEGNWKHQEREAIDYDYVTSPLDDSVMRIARRYRAVDFDGPSWSNIDRLDFFEQAGKQMIPEMRYATRRLYLDIEEVEALSVPDAQGRSIFNPAAVRKLKSQGYAPKQLMSDMTQSRGLTLLNGWSGTSPGVRPVELLDHVGWIPSELAPDGISFRRITIGNGQVVLRNVPFPYAHGSLAKVFFAYSPFTDVHYFDAPGKIEVAFKMQRAGNKFINQTLDGLEVAVSPYIWADEKAQLDPRSTQLGPGRILITQGDPNALIKEGRFDMSGIGAGMNAAQMMSQMIQQVTGIDENAVQGIKSGNPETARGALMRAEAAGSRLDHEAEMAEVQALVPYADAVMDLNRQFLTRDEEVRLIGDQAITDPVTNEPVTSLVVSPRHTAFRLRARAKGVSSRLSKSVQMQNAMLLMQTAFGAAASNPAVMAKLNMLGWIRWLAKIAEASPEVNELVNQDPKKYQEELALMMQGASAGKPATVQDPGGTGIENGAPSGPQPDDGSALANMVGTLSGGLQ
jgi:hypothetical protein